MYNTNYSKYDIIVVGAGLTGAISARYHADIGKKVLVLEKRNHIAGNLYDYTDKKGNLVQMYGPHCFHTNDEKVVSFIRKYSDWYDYTVNCNVYMNNKFTPSPFNFKTIDQYYSKTDAEKLKNELLLTYPNNKSVTIVELLNSKNQCIKDYADFLFNSDYSLYTAKQWGISADQVDPKVLKRVPILLNYDEQYFYDKYQLMPKNGYTKFIRSMLYKKNIDVVTNFDFLNIVSFTDNEVIIDNEIYKGKIIYTGAIDRLFNYKFGFLPYRSLRFEMKNIKTKSYQSAPIVAYPQVEGYTRITEYTKMPYQYNEWTSIALEYPQKYDEKTNEPYYPINNKENDKLHSKYLLEANKYSNLFLVGRLAKYQYFNMDQAISDTMSFLGL